MCVWRKNIVEKFIETAQFSSVGGLHFRKPNSILNLNFYYISIYIAQLQVSPSN
jgi:hypothetical protein